MPIADEPRNPVAEIPLPRGDSETRAFDPAGRAVAIDGVRFGGWQIHPANIDANEYPDASAFLVRVNYDMRYLPGAPRPDTVTVEFDVGDAAVVLDVVPRAVRRAVESTEYGVTKQFNFTPIERGSVPGQAIQVVLPAAEPVLETLGCGGPAVTFRHGGTGPIAAGAHVAWLALLVDQDRRDLPVRVTAGYEWADATTAPVNGTGEFTVRLPAHTPQPGAPRANTPQANAPQPNAPQPNAPQPNAPRSRAMAADATRSSPLQFRLGFVIDLVGYSDRTEPEQKQAQERIIDLAYDVLHDLELEDGDIFLQSTGDGVNAILPVDIDYSLIVTNLRRHLVQRLAVDNDRHQDRMRLRMAIDIGPGRLGANGFTGDTIIAFNRLVNTADIRQVMRDQPATDFAMIVSELVYRSIVEHGYPGLSPAEFTPIDAVVKGYQAPAWMWVAPATPRSPGQPAR